MALQITFGWAVAARLGVARSGATVYPQCAGFKSQGTTQQQGVGLGTQQHSGGRQKYNYSGGNKRTTIIPGGWVILTFGEGLKRGCGPSGRVSCLRRGSVREQGDGAV
jgi:hypothetical protein